MVHGPFEVPFVAGVEIRGRTTDPGYEYFLIGFVVEKVIPERTFRTAGTRTPTIQRATTPRSPGRWPSSRSRNPAPVLC